MLTIVFWIGIIFVVFGISLLIYMGLQAKSLRNLDADARQKFGQKLIMLNFSGLAASLIGIMCIMLSFIMG